MELWDVYDRNRNKTGRVHERGVPIARGDYHICVFVWVFNSKGQMLLTKRSPEKAYYSNLWANTGGAAILGESSIQAVQRELYEETGIHADFSELHFVATYRRKSAFCDIYFLFKDVELSEVVLQPGETCDAIWVDRSTLERLIGEKQVAQPDVDRYRQLKEQIWEHLR